MHLYHLGISTENIMAFLNLNICVLLALYNLFATSYLFAIINYAYFIKNLNAKLLFLCIKTTKIN